MKWIFNRYMIAGAILGWLILSSLSEIHETAQHKGPGIVHYGDGESGPERSEEVTEDQYKRHGYVMGGMMLFISIALWLMIARSAQPKAAATN